MKVVVFLLLFIGSVNNIFCQQYKKEDNSYVLTTEGASHLASLPLKCIKQEFPYKTGVVFTDTSLITEPKNYHPVFYGCFDWHSSAHGHWMLIRLLKKFPEIPQADTIRALLKDQLTSLKIRAEVKLFGQKENRSFERTYGWAWIMQMQKELLEWNDPLERSCPKILNRFLVFFQSFILNIWVSYCILYVWVNTPTLLWFKACMDYAEAAGDESLKTSIRTTALRFYRNDVNCPLSWEPGGTDFLSPCLEEADLMWRILLPRNMNYG
jgi:hypothetical protein